MLDKILDFLFRKATGLVITLTATVIGVLTLSGCFTYDCSVWMCRTVTCNEDACQGCLDDSIQCDNEQYIRQERNRFGLNGWKKRFMTEEQIERTYNELDCYYSETGCESEENCGYIVCGGTNLSCWNTICEGGLCISSMELYSGNQACTCLNCTLYRDGKPAEDDYIPDSHGRSCAGCDNGPYKPKDYDESLYHPYYTVGFNEMKNGCGAQEHPSNVGTNHGKIHLLLTGEETTTFATVIIYDATTRVPTPTKDGYEFRGYYSEPMGRGIRLADSDGAVLDKNKLVSEGKSGIYAHFVKKQSGAITTEVDVDFNGSISTHTVTAGEDLEALINSIYHLNYNNRDISVTATFNGKTQEIANTSGFGEEYRIYDPADYGIELHGEILLIKVTEKDLFHKVTLKIFDTAGVNEFPHETPLSTIPAQPFDGYRFLGWSTADDSIENILPDDFIINRSLTLFAVYRKNVSFTLSGTESYQTYAGESLTLPEASSVPDGMRFAGWYPEGGMLADGTPIEKKDAFIGIISVGENWNGVTFIPVWESNSYNVNYFVGGTLYATDTYNYGEGLTLSDNAEVEFYTFGGWSATEGGNIAVSEISSTDFGEKSFYAILSPSSYTVELNSKNGIVSSNEITLLYGTGAGEYFIEVPERVGYKFIGWYVLKNGVRVYLTDALGTSVADFCADTLGISTEEELADVEFVADWDVLTYTVRFFVNGELYTEQTVEHGKCISANAEPTIAGYDFISWTLYGTPFDTATPITADTDLVAKVKARSFKLSLKVHESDGYYAWAGTDGAADYGTDTYQTNVIYGDILALIEVEIFSNTAKSFAGWGYNGVTVIDAEGNIVNAELLGSITADADGYITLVALWQ